MMKSIHQLKNLFMLSLLSITLTATAAEPSQQQNDRTNASAPPQIMLYASNNDKKIIKTLSPTAHLIKIYQKGDWIKVGNTADGTVGWINQQQYQKALEDFNQPNIQEIFISQTVDKNNKPLVKIIAYQNSKPVSTKEAKALYDEMKKQQQLQAQYWQKFNQNMAHWKNQLLTNFYQDPFFNQTMPFPMPIVIIEKSDAGKN